MILIVGGLGFIGMHACREFVQHGGGVAATRYRANRDSGLMKELFGDRLEIVPLDVTDASAVRYAFEKLSVTSVVNLLAPPPGAWSPGEEYRANMFGLINLLEASREAGVKRVTLASSLAVYHSFKRGPFRETARLPVESGNPTEAFKKAEEILALHYADRTGLDVRIARLPGVWGPLYHSMLNFPSRVCHAAARGEPLQLTSRRGGQLHAEDASDICYVKDVARALRLLHTAPRLRHRIYNVGSGVATTNAAVVEAAAKAVPGFSAELPPGRGADAQENAYLDISRLRRDTGFEPEYDVKRGVADYIAWLRTHAE